MLHIYEPTLSQWINESNLCLNWIKPWTPPYVPQSLMFKTTITICSRGPITLSPQEIGNNFKWDEHMYHNDLEKYLENLHQESLNGFAFVYHSLAAYFQPTNLFWVNPIFLEEGGNNCQTVQWRSYYKMVIIKMVSWPMSMTTLAANFFPI